MPTINKPFLLALVLVTLALAGLLFGAHTLQASRIPDALRRQADRAEEAGKSTTAIHYLRQYLEFVPDDGDVMAKLADLLKARAPTYRGYTELIFLYDKILRLDPDRHPVRRDALAACLRINRFSDAVTHAEALLAAFPAEAELWRQLGAAQAGLNKLDDARTSYEKAVTHAPDEIRGYQVLTELVWRNMNKTAEAKAVLDRMVVALPQDPAAYLSRAKFESAVADEEASKNRPATYDPAMHDLRRVLELDPENADASFLLAEILQKGRDVPAAHAILRDAVSLYPRDLRLVRGLAWLELIRGNVAASVAVLEEGLKHSPDGFDLLVPLADLLVQQGDTVRSAEIIKGLEKRKAPAAQVKYLAARMAMRQEHWAEAIGLLETLRGDALRLPGLEAQLNLLLATCFERTADPDAQGKALHRVTGADQGNAPARAGLATLYLNLGRFDDAAREFEAAVRSPYAPASIHAQWIRLQARRLRTAGGAPDDWRKLEHAAAEAVAKFGPVSSEAVILQAEVAVAEGKAGTALGLLRKEVARRPGDTRLWAALAETAADAKGTAAGLEVMDEAQAAAGDGPEIRLARARLYAREPGRVRPIEPLTERTDTWAEADQLRLLYGLIEVYDQTGDRAKLVQTLRKVAAHRPTEAAVWLRLFERATDAGDAATAAEARAAIVKIEGEAGPSVVICDAAGSQDTRIADRLLAAFGPVPNRADACLALARIKEKAGDLPEVMRLTERAFVLDPTQFEAARAWVALLCSTGADDRAAKLVARLAVDPRWAGEPFRRMIGGVIERLPPTVGVNVIAWCRPLVERDPGGPGWLAACCATVGKPAEAEAMLVSATQVPGATADDWLRLALHHAAAGKTSAAAEVLTAARAKVDARSYFSLAAAFRETPGAKDWTPTASDPADRRLFAQAQLAVKLSRSEPAGATKMLEAFVAEAGVPPADTVWARRNLAMLYAIGGTPEERARAVKLVADTKDENPTLEELRATASILTTLARYLEGDERKAVLGQAAAALEAALQLKDSPRDKYNLSQVYRVAGNRAASRKRLNELLAADQKNIYYLTSALEELTADRNFQSAEAFAGRLQSLYPGEFRAVAAVARFECKAGRPGRALALAERYAAAADAGAGDYLARSARVAELLDELVRAPNVRNTPVGRQMTDAAVERFTALVPARPEAAIGIAGVLAADGRVAEAFEKIGQLGRYLPVRARALAGIAALRSGGATDSQFTTVQNWLADALSAEQGSVSMRLNEAEFLALRQDYPKAAAVYEAILKTEPRNVVALNNLAWIHAADPATAEKAVELLNTAARDAGLTGELLDTRARARITLKQFEAADRDLTEAMTQEATALRWFHRAVLLMSKTPPDRDGAAKAFAEARSRGIDPKMIHPADLPVYRVLEAATGQTTKP